jgi:hypothetical protein
MCTCASSSRFQKANLRPALHSTSVTGRRSIGLSLPVRRTHAIAIVHDGQVVAERYADGFDIDTPVHGWSATKSVNNGLPGSSYAKGSSRWTIRRRGRLLHRPPEEGFVQVVAAALAGHAVHVLVERGNAPVTGSPHPEAIGLTRISGAVFGPQERSHPGGVAGRQELGARLGTHKEDVSPGEMQKRVRKMFWPRQW